ncbi:hypothetical protein [Candidatus Nanohalobium constans]|uniref:HEPN domain-containing protein n=1 Tax=Candidatus Nanohalobium constans TaxID=2565781 RepID=A0A5Q0UG89_9ARCH|nr:hypothetical protein [Candidatus Nanohalobium constans]QGA80401.1 hypothetical protein LC1Nh_0501 [Candidatus Nanohalobium constans]
MRNFNELLKDDRVEEVSEDYAKQKGLIKRSKARLENQKSRKIDENTAFEILENIYESLREALEAAMAADGYKSNDHVSTIAYAKDELEFNRSIVNRLHRFRKLRNESRYEAREIKVEEAGQIKEFAEEIIPEIEQKIKERN